MLFVQSTVRNGAVKIPEVAKVPDGSRVIVMILGSAPHNDRAKVLNEIESEDVEFVRSCRGRLGRQLQEDDLQ